MQPIKQFQELSEVQCYSNATKSTYLYHIKNFLKVYHDDLKQENILKYLVNLRKKGYSGSSINLVRAALLYFFKKVLKKKITIEIPTIRRKKPLPKPVDREVIIKLIENTKNLKHRILIELMYSSGIRLGEVVKIKWEDFDFINKIIRINNGKGGKDRLSILSNQVIQHLIDFKEISNFNYVFYSTVRPHTHISKKTVQKVLENASKKSKLKFIVTPHQLRHSFATHLLEDGSDIRVIQDLLGHSSPKTTMIYTKVTKKNRSKIVSPLDTINGIKPENEYIGGKIKTNKNYIENRVKTNE